MTIGKGQRGQSKGVKSSFDLCGKGVITFVKITDIIKDSSNFNLSQRKT